MFGKLFACTILAFILFSAIYFILSGYQSKVHSISCSCNVTIMTILEKYQNGCQNRDFSEVTEIKYVIGYNLFVSSFYFIFPSLACMCIILWFNFVLGLDFF